jgi:D-tagatose-1,6-bisphosphate aldolase subunit GatZ/KbaZ
MYLDEVVAAQKRGEARGIPSVCSAHPYVLRETLKVFAKHPGSEAQRAQTFRVSPLIEATCNQVNQFGGYTGMTPADFVRYVRGIAQENQFPFEDIILGGDHLGPSVWQAEPVEVAMRKAETMVRDYVEAGFVKIHLDCSMRLADDSQDALDMEVSAKRAARLARIAEDSISQPPSGVLREEMGRGEGLRYVIGTEVPVPGGATEHEESVRVTKVEDVRQTIEVTREAFYREGLRSAWERVIAIVVQPGVEFGDDFILPYRPVAAQELSQFIESQPVVYEAHSTDYQTCQALKDLVRDHFAILKVGPALTFAFREGVFALAMIENELVPSQERSNIISVLDEAMTERPEHWAKYYHGDETEQFLKRKYSFSDRIRYYWTEPRVQHALNILLTGLTQISIPTPLLRQFVPDICATHEDKWKTITSEQILLTKIENVLEDYNQACSGA